MDTNETPSRTDVAHAVENADPAAEALVYVIALMSARDAQSAGA